MATSVLTDELSLLRTYVSDVKFIKDPQLGKKLFDVGNLLVEEEIASFFVDEGGVKILYEAMKIDHQTVQKAAVNVFLSLLCHFPVLQKLSVGGDGDLFNAVVELTYKGDCAFDLTRINSACCILNIFTDLCADGAELFHKAVMFNSTSKRVEPYAHLVGYLKDPQFCKKVLQLLVCAMRSPISSCTIEMLKSLKKSGIVQILESTSTLKNFTEEEKVCVSDILKPFGVCKQKELWFRARLPFFANGRRISSLIKANMSLNKPVLGEGLILKLVDQELTDRLDEEMVSYDSKWLCIEDRWRNMLVEGKERDDAYRSIQQMICDGIFLNSVILKQRNTIRNDQSLWCFYRSLQLNLNRVMVALQSIQSDLINQSDKKSTVTNVCQTAITLAGESVPLPAVQAAANGFTDIMERYRSRKRKQQNSQMSIIATNVGDMEEISEACARLLTFRFAEQLKVTTKERAKLLGATGARFILEHLRCGSMNVLDSPLLSRGNIVNALVNVFGDRINNKIEIPLRDGEVWDPVSIFPKTEKMKSNEGKCKHGLPEKVKWARDEVQRMMVKTSKHDKDILNLQDRVSKFRSIIDIMKVKKNIVQ